MKPADSFKPLWEDPANWRLRSIYFCADDPRLVVPKRIRWTGSTLNFAHRASYALLLTVLVAATAPVLLLVALGIEDLYPILGAFSVSIVLVIGLLWWGSRVR